VVPMQAFLFEILSPIFLSTTECSELYAPGGELLRAGDTFRFAELGDLLDRLGAEGPGFLYSGDVAHACSEWVLERGGLLTRQDLASYAVEDREPAQVVYQGREVLTNPPPSSGGILIAYALELLDRRGAASTDELVAAMEAAQRARTEEFLDGLYEPGFADEFLDPDRLRAAADRLGSTTHITAVDGDGRCATVTCSNGTGSGLIVPGTGVHVNNMLGEEDLNPHGFHRHIKGRRMPSMMSPTVVLHGGELEVGLGSGGSNRIRSAILQTIVRLVDDGLDISAAVIAPRVHFEAGSVQSEPGIDEAALARLERRGYEVFRWPDRNVFFGGVHAVARDPLSGRLRGAGDPRRGGAVAVV
jgi:gamma-glutamyltranspeptidase / glutathione hydrolase